MSANSESKTTARPTMDRWAGNSNIYSRCNFNLLPGAVGIGSHKHNFDHVSFYWGSLRLEANIPGKGQIDKVFQEIPGKPNQVLIKAGIEHKLTALPHRPVLPQDIQAVINAAEKVAFARGSVEELQQALKKSYESDASRRSHVVCTYAHRNPQGEVTMEYTGYDDAAS